MNISFTVAVNGIPLAPSPLIETSINAGPTVQVEEAVASPADADRETDQATPVIPLGSSVLAPGFEAALEF